MQSVEDKLSTSLDPPMSITSVLSLPQRQHSSALSTTIKMNQHRSLLQNNHTIKSHGNTTINNRSSLYSLSSMFPTSVLTSKLLPTVTKHRKRLSKRRQKELALAEFVERYKDKLARLSEKLNISTCHNRSNALIVSQQQKIQALNDHQQQQQGEIQSQTSMTSSCAAINHDFEDSRRSSSTIASSQTQRFFFDTSNNRNQYENVKNIVSDKNFTLCDGHQSKDPIAIREAIEQNFIVVDDVDLEAVTATSSSSHHHHSLNNEDDPFDSYSSLLNDAVAAADMTLEFYSDDEDEDEDHDDNHDDIKGSHDNTFSTISNNIKIDRDGNAVMDGHKIGIAFEDSKSLKLQTENNK